MEISPPIRASPPFTPFHPFVKRVGVKGCACIKSSMLGNEKYTGDVLVYKTFMDEYPSGARIRNDGQHEQFLARNHHVAIIDKELFDAVQAARLVRTNVTVDEDGNRVRKSTKYSSKRKS